MTERVIHLVFKTHLDIGFTDHAEKVRRQYHERFIPQAIDTGEHFYREDPTHPKFIWTTGAWLIFDHLEHAGKAAAARLERAIERGLIRWHALPFTTHSELMSPDLFRAGLSYGQELDRRFGRTTIAAKMTDVPGHTIGIVPLLAEAGVRFLHLGVNSASPVPDVPDVFRWRAPAGEEVVVMYQNSYGATHFPDGFDDGLSFAHTIDNVGPQSVSQTADAYRHLQAEHPDARIEAATLDDYGALLWAARARFPVIDLEIGDSWIQGIGTDPTKTARFLALQRLYDGFARRDDDARAARLRPWPRHGRRAHLGRRHQNLPPRRDGVGSAGLRGRAPKATRASPTPKHPGRSRGAISTRPSPSLSETDRALAAAALAPLEPAPGRGAAVPLDGPLEIAGWTITVDSPDRRHRHAGLARTAPIIDGLDGSLLGYRYESYDSADMARHLDSYLHAPGWIGPSSTTTSRGWPARERRDRRDGCRGWPACSGNADALTMRLDLPARGRRRTGRAGRVELVLRPAGADEIEIAVVMRRKAGEPDAGGELRDVHAGERRRLGVPQDGPVAEGEPGRAARRRSVAGGHRRAHPARRRASDRGRPLRHAAGRAGRDAVHGRSHRRRRRSQRGYGSTCTTTNGARIFRCGGRAISRRDSTLRVGTAAE